MPAAWILVSLVVAAALLPAAARAQVLFGKNKVQYDRRDWFTLRTPHAEIFFYPEEEGLAREVAAIAESTCAEYDGHFRMRPRRPIPILIFSSHQAFQQTNAAQGLISEGTGGLTELIKGRVLIPHVGSRRRLIWVTRHELTHAYMLEKLSQVLQAHNRYQYSMPPLWLTEGLAEFLGTHWDSQAEGLLQDAVVSDRAYPVTESYPITGTVLMYKEGQSFLLWLAQKYSRPQVMSLFDNWWKADDVQQIFRLTFGRTLKSLDEEWFHELKRRYYPKVADRDWTADAARPLTGGDSFDLAPVGYDAAGDSTFRFAYLSAEEGATDLELATVHGGRVTEERLLRGGFSDRFESFHLFQTRLGVSRDGRIALVSQRGGRDVVHVLDVATRTVIATWGLPGVVGLSNPSWLPGDSTLVIVGQRENGQIDLFRVHVTDGRTVALTDDPFEEQEVTVRPDGRTVVFASDRDGGAEGYHHLYERDLATGTTRLLTSGAASEREPSWSPDGRTLVFRSDRDGIDDLYLWRDGRVKRLTHLLGPAYSPAWSPDGRSILFSGESRLEFHIYQIPVMDSARAAARDTLGRGMAAAAADSATADSAGGKAARPAAPPAPARTALAGGDSGWVAEPTDSALAAWPPLVPSAEPVRPYRRRFGLDVAQNGVALDPSLGAVGAGQVALSDLLGDESLYIFLANDSENFGSFLDGFEAGLTYFNQKQRFNFGGGLFRLTTVYDPDLDVIRRERRIGGLLIASYPFSKFTRLEGSFVLRYAQDHFLRNGNFEDLWLASNFLTLVRDNSRWTEMGPAGGTRWNFSGGFTRDLSSGSGDYFTLTTDYRHYLEPVRNLIYASRVLGEHSFGDDAERFYIGGRYSLRGYPRRFMSGHTIALVQQELRFPLLSGLVLGFPAPWRFPPISGAVFGDVAATGDVGERFERRASYGFGVYIGGAYFPNLRWDFIRRHDFRHAEKGWLTQFTFGFLY